MKLVVLVVTKLLDNQ